MSFWDQLVAEFESLGQVVAEWLPRILVALLILIIGRWILKWVRKLIEKLLNLSFVQGIFDRAGITSALASSDQTAAGITASIVYAYLVVVLWLVVVRVLQIITLEDLLERFLAWIPTVLLAVLVVVIAASIAGWVAALVKPFADSKGVGWLTWLAHIAVIVFGVLFALDILEVTFAEDITKILTAAAGVAFAIAFGVGGIDTGKKWWAKYLSPKETGSQ
ncbi:MAG: mechanosensitive ion channel family protein [Acidimicrobiia bacterium]